MALTTPTTGTRLRRRLILPALLEAVPLNEGVKRGVCIHELWNKTLNGGYVPFLQSGDEALRGSDQLVEPSIQLLDLRLFPSRDRNRPDLFELAAS